MRKSTYSAAEPGGMAEFEGAGENTSRINKSL